ncbi:hypothetical protein [Kingella negevensis]|uniref:hypothetical protein n=1 Tax=Kingella negevensis TaxID=1522312 RepID=UPI00254BA5A3|nr:hypothetical protein [Kingella negevensis]MDK4679931.1 hypothetical protein [Kingella negevensis]MDK4682350.1 hypothetical protein [Kingella negevensis]MDK4690547.1 hypothetical protein [Kingella negevensis]MDK4692105.1 hypothetical protein [Kingella negevensis]MDK4698409.1 hypothetical protein [Kingella negevensis]
MLTLDIRFNQIIATTDEQENAEPIQFSATFSNNRLIVSDFNAFVAALKAVLEQAAAKGYYTPFNQITGKLLATTVRLDVREELQGGLSAIEYKVLQESMIATNLRGREICYRGAPVFFA